MEEAEGGGVEGAKGGGAPQREEQLRHRAGVSGQERQHLRW